MSNVIPFKQLDPNSLSKLLKSLKEKERLMVNPPLKDWFEIRNQIRKVESNIGAFKNE